MLDHSILSSPAVPPDDSEMLRQARETLRVYWQALWVPVTVNTLSDMAMYGWQGRRRQTFASAMAVKDLEW
jgi:hypothetical protein